MIFFSVAAFLFFFFLLFLPLFTLVLFFMMRPPLIIRLPTPFAAVIPLFLNDSRSCLPSNTSLKTAFPICMASGATVRTRKGIALLAMPLSTENIPPPLPACGGMNTLISSSEPPWSSAKSESYSARVGGVNGLDIVTVTGGIRRLGLNVGYLFIFCLIWSKTVTDLPLPK